MGEEDYALIKNLSAEDFNVSEIRQNKFSIVGIHSSGKF